MSSVAISPPSVVRGAAPEKARQIGLTDSKDGFAFLSCHPRKRVSGRLLENRPRRYYQLRWPFAPSLRRVSQCEKDETSSRKDRAKNVRMPIWCLILIPRGWGAYFHTGNATEKVNRLDSYVSSRLHRFGVRRKGRNPRAGEVEA